MRTIRFRIIFLLIGLSYSIASQANGNKEFYSYKKVEEAIQRYHISGGRFFNDAYDFKTLDFTQSVNDINASNDYFIFRSKTVPRAEAQESYDALKMHMEVIFATGFRRKEKTYDNGAIETKWTSEQKVNYGRNIDYYEQIKCYIEYNGENATVALVMITMYELPVTKPVDTREAFTLKTWTEKAVESAEKNFDIFVQGDYSTTESDAKYRVGDFEKK